MMTVLLINMGQRSISQSVFSLFVLANCFNIVVVRHVAGSDARPQCVSGPGKASFSLYNSDDPNGTIVDLNSANATVPLRTDARLFFFIHGFTANPFSIRWLALEQCVVDELDANVVIVDWTNGSCSTGGTPSTRLSAYSSAVKNAKNIGEQVAEFIMKLISDYEVKLEDIVVVGHSLGSHVGSFCSKHLQDNHIGILGEIWGLDPAGPGFEGKDCKNSLCVSDAKFVQIFHTSSAYGMHKAIGNKDFYFNGGSYQPNCAAANLAMCSHAGAVEFLIHIVRDSNCKYIGKKWTRGKPSPSTVECSADTCSSLGPLAHESSANGTFYVDTTSLAAECVSYTSPSPNFLQG